MSPRIAGMHIVAVLTLLGAIATADVLPLPAATLFGPEPAPVCPAAQQTGPTEVDKAYYYSTIGQELAYAKIRENAAYQADKVPPVPKRQTGPGLQAPVTVSPLSPILCPPVCVLCPLPSRLMGMLQAAGCRL